MTAFTLRPTRIDDVAALPAIERAAGQRFRDVPELAWLADNEVICVEDHLGYAGRGLSWLALADDRPVGFILAEAHPSSLFIVELSVHPTGRDEVSTPVNRPCRRACPQSGAELADVNDVS